MAIVSYTWEEIQKLPKLPMDWERLRNMKDEDIDYSDNPDVTEMLEKGYYRRINHYDKPQPKSVMLKLSPFVVNKLQETGKNWHKRLNEGVENWLLQGGLAKVGVL